ncbi:unnamed protein product [Pseudo-nitzschia multistriata]|uniref:6-pyruvoyltetrahydropterin synthase n=1 Tax=Pseudo-nitzschia multistriata TaxID=183589 RepID=A0A448ZDB1_9STRA|nr:unnamed protein product [Pseudo-nitzschia multistriata]
MSLSTATAHSSLYATNFEVYVNKADFKFNAAHFVAFQGFRERLHGHNYTVGVRLLGSRKICHDGYVLDFGDVKKVVKAVCKKLNERFLCPTKSDVIDTQIVDTENDGRKSVVLTCEDGSRFVIPLDDCAMIPIVHATVEELAIYTWGEILDGLDPELLRRRGIHTMEVVMAEAPGQEAVFRLEIPETKNGEKFRLDVPSFINSGEIELKPKPCFGQEGISETRNKAKLSDTGPGSRSVTPKNTAADGHANCEDCGLASFSKQLEALASALNNRGPLDDELTADDLRSLLEKE